MGVPYYISLRPQASIFIGFGQGSANTRIGMSIARPLPSLQTGIKTLYTYIAPFSKTAVFVGQFLVFHGSLEAGSMPG